MAGSGRAVSGFDEEISLFSLLPEAARDELIVEAAIVAREVLGAQQADTPVHTGRLRRSLSLKTFTSGFGFIAGLLNVRAASKTNGRVSAAQAGGPYYGRFVALGRSAQTVNVTRRVKKRKGPTRGRLRRRSSPNAGTPVGGPYRLRVRAQAARDFIRQPIIEQAADRALSEIWSKTLTRAEGGT